MTTPCDPSAPLRADATDDQIEARDKWLWRESQRDCSPLGLDQTVVVARELAASERAAHAVETRAAVRAALMELVDNAFAWGPRSTADIEAWMNRNYPALSLPESPTPETPSDRAQETPDHWMRRALDRCDMLHADVRLKPCDECKRAAAASPTEKNHE